MTTRASFMGAYTNCTGKFIRVPSVQKRPEGFASQKRTASWVRWGLRRSARTAQVPNPDLGWAEICHPFHPLKGQRFPVLKTRRVGGVDTLLLGHVERGSFSIAREWTDWGAPSDHDDCNPPVCCFDLGKLLEFIDQLGATRPRTSSPKGR